MSLRHWVHRGTGTPKDKDEVNRPEVSECDGWVCGLEVMGVPSILSIIRKTVVLARARPILDLSWTEQAARRKWKSPRLCCASWTPYDRCPPTIIDRLESFFCKKKMVTRDMLWLLFVSATAASMSTARPGASLFAVLFLSTVSCITHWWYSLSGVKELASIEEVNGIMASSSSLFIAFLSSRCG